MESLSSWHEFVLRHQTRLNLQMHFLSFLLYYGSFIAAIIGQSWWWLCGLPLSGIVGTLGHIISRESRVKLKEATFDPQAVFYVTLIFWKIFRGTYAQDIAAAHKAYIRVTGHNHGDHP